MSQESSVDEEINLGGTIKLLVASDIHLGCEEKDPIPGQAAFEEVKKARANDESTNLLDEAVIKEQFKKGQQENQSVEEVVILSPRGITESLRRPDEDGKKFYEEKAVKFVEAQLDSATEVTKEKGEVLAGSHEHEINLRHQISRMLNEISNTSKYQGQCMYRQANSGKGLVGPVPVKRANVVPPVTKDATRTNSKTRPRLLPIIDPIISDSDSD
uniref:Mre11 DNA-binding domain-containing protein n=1 Tax=Anopheles atroparvus TaxID=41427 RepID=A0A182JI43_ANOAO